MNFETINDQDLWELKKNSVLEAMIKNGENYLSKIKKIEEHSEKKDIFF